MDFKRQETCHSSTRTREELQNAFGGGIPSGTQVGNLAAGFLGSYLGGGLSRTNFLGARHA